MKYKLMKTINRISLMSIVALLFFASCKKDVTDYPQGGAIAQAPVYVLKEWSMEKAFKNGTLVTSVPENPQINEVTEDMTFKNDGTFIRSNGTVQLSGTWELINNNSQIRITVTTPSENASVMTYNILKLTSGTDGQFFWEHTHNGSKYRYESRASL
jgi:hypothetical protein